MDDDWKKALDQAAALHTPDVLRATESLRALTEGPGMSAVRQAMEDMNRHRELIEGPAMSATRQAMEDMNRHRELIEGPTISATRQAIEDMNRQHDLHRVVTGLDRFSESFMRDFERDQAMMRSFRDDLAASITGISKQYEAMHDLTAPLASSLAGLDFSELATETSRVSEYLTSIMGPANELRASGMLADLSPQFAGASAISEMLAAQARDFVVPHADLVRRLAEEADAARRFMTNADLAGFAERMTQPWILPDFASQSFDAFADLQAIAAAAKSANPFSDEVSDLIRSSLGDWRGSIAWPAEGLASISVRAAFYADQGFDTDLADMPPPAFEQSIEIAGLIQVRPNLIALFGEPVPLADPETEAIFARSNRAQLWLTRFEYHFRRFVHAKMVAQFGDQWPKHKLDPDTYRRWIDKRDKAQKTDKSAMLIEYADLTDFERFLFAKDVWPLFQPYLVRKESALESLQRLYPIRNPAYHARALSLTDELYLLTELQRLTSLFMA